MESGLVNCNIVEREEAGSIPCFFISGISRPLRLQFPQNTVDMLGVLYENLEIVAMVRAISSGEFGDH